MVGNFYKKLIRIVKIHFYSPQKRISLKVNKLYFYKKALSKEYDKLALNIVCGELLFGFNPKIVNLFSEALERGKRINVISGPRVVNRKNGVENPSLLLLNKYIKINSQVNLRYIKIKHAWPFHFAFCGPMVLLENPHPPTQGGDKKIVEYYENDLYWSDYTKSAFNFLMKKSEGIDKMQVIEYKKLGTYEKSREYRDFIKQYKFKFAK
jgi:hypothetical protein